MKVHRKKGSRRHVNKGSGPLGRYKSAESKARAMANLQNISEARKAQAMQRASVIEKKHQGEMVERLLRFGNMKRYVVERMMNDPERKKKMSLLDEMTIRHLLNKSEIAYRTTLERVDGPTPHDLADFLPAERIALTIVRNVSRFPEPGQEKPVTAASQIPVNGNGSNGTGAVN